MRIYRTVGPIVAVSAAMLLASCGGGGDGSGDTSEGDGPSLPSLEDSLGVASVVRDWDPCEILSDDLHELVEFMEYEGFSDDLISSPYGVGTPSDLGQCMGTAIWTQHPEKENIQNRGMVVFAVTADHGEEEAATHYEEIVSRNRDVFEQGDSGEIFEETALTGSWDESTFIHGDYGLGDTFVVVARDGEFIVNITVEAGSAPDGEGSGSIDRKFDLEEVKQHLLETTVPNVHTTVLEDLEAAGMSPDE